MEAHAAARAMPKADLELLVQKAVHVDSCFDHYVNSQNDTLLHLAVLLDCWDSANLLLSVGANPLIFNNDQLTPMQLAEETGNQIMIQLLYKWEYYRSAMLGISVLGARTATPFSSPAPAAAAASSSQPSHTEKMIIYNTRAVVSHLDYLEWTGSVRRFHLKELLDKLKTDEREDWSRLHKQQAHMRQLTAELAAQAELLSARQHQLSSSYWKEEQAVRGLRQSLASVTDFISSLRAKLSEVSAVAYWTGDVQVRLHKGPLLEVWRPYRMSISGAQIAIFHDDGRNKRRRTIAIDDLQTVVVIKTADFNRLDKALLLEYFSCKPILYPDSSRDAASSAANSQSKRKLQTLQLRFVEQTERTPGAGPRLPTADHLAHVLKLLNDRIEIRCEIDGSRRVVYELGRGPRGRDSDAGLGAEAAGSPDRGRARRATFDASFSRYFEDSEVGDMSYSLYRRRASMSYSSASGSSRGRSLSMSCSSGSSGSGVTSVESLSSIASAQRARLRGIREEEEAQSMAPSVDDLVKASASAILVTPTRQSMSALPPQSFSLSPMGEGQRHVPEGDLADVSYLHQLRTILTQSTEARDRIHRQLEQSVADKESLRGPLAFLRALMNVVVRPPMLANESLQLDRLVAHLEGYARAMDGPLKRGSSFAGNELAGSVGSADADEAAQMVSWLAATHGQSHINSRGLSALPSHKKTPVVHSTPSRDPLQRSNSLSGFLSPFSLSPFTSRCSFREAQIELSDAGCGHSGAGPSDGDADQQAADDRDRERAPMKALCSSSRATLGPPPIALRDDCEAAMRTLDGLWLCGQRAFEDAERLAQLLVLKEDVWRRYQELRDDDHRTQTAPVAAELVDVDF